MSYQTGSASSPVDLLQQLVTWLVGIGWTQDRSAIEGTGWTASLHKSGNYAHFRAVMAEATPWTAGFSDNTYALDFYLASAFDSGQPWNNQVAGAPVGATSLPVGVGMRLTAGPFSNYYFFADSAGDNVVVVVEVTAGLFTHLGWGLSVQKAGAWTGGPYFFGSTSGYYASWATSNPNYPGLTSSSDCPFVGSDASGTGAVGFVRADVDSYTGGWLAMSGPAVTGGNQGLQGKMGDTSVRGTGKNMESNFPVYAYDYHLYQFQNEQVSAQDGRANLLPILLWARRDGTTTGFSLLGTVPGVFVTNSIGNGFSAGDEYVLGTTTYKLFPNFAVVKQ